MFSTLSPIQKGMIFALAGYTGFAWSDATVKFLTGGYPVFQIIFTIMAFSALYMLILKRWTDTPRAPLRRKQFAVHILRGVTNISISLLFVASLSKLPLATVYTFIFAKPFFAALMTMALYGEHVTIRRWIVIAAGFAGIMVAMRPGTESFDTLLFYPLLAAVFSALMFVVSKSLEGESVFRLAFFPSAFTALLCLPLAVPEFIVPNLMDIPLFMLSAFGITVGIIGLTLGYRTAPSSAVSPFHYTQMIWGLIFGVLIFGDIPDIWTMAGAAIIIASGLFLIWGERKG